MKDVLTKVLGGIGLQGLFLAAAVITLGTPAGFSIRGLSWKFPWLEQSASAPATPNVLIAPTTEIAPVSGSPALSLQCIAASQASAIFCVVVKNPGNRSLLLHSGQLNLSEVGLAPTPWSAPATAPWLPERLPVARVQIAADRGLPGTPLVFPLELAIPPGHERRFLLHVDMVHLPASQRHHFFAVGSLVLSAGTEELSTADFNVFGARLEQIESSAAETLAHPYAPPASTTSPHIVARPSDSVPPPPRVILPPLEPEPPDLIERVSSRLGKMAADVSDLRHKVPLPFSARPDPGPEVRSAGK